jgi:hypothetical protein
MNTPTIGEPTKKSIYLEIEQTRQQSLNIEIKKPKPPKYKRTTYEQDFSNNYEVYIYRQLNPEY